MVTYYFSPFWDCGIVHAHIEDTRVVIFPWIIEHHIIYVIIMQWWVRIVHRRSCLVGLVRLYWVYCKPCTLHSGCTSSVYSLFYILYSSKPSPIYFSRKLFAAKQSETGILVTYFMKTQCFASLSLIISLWSKGTTLRDFESFLSLHQSIP